MVKIRELTHEQLLDKMYYYLDLYYKLDRERLKRIEKFGALDELLTDEEKENGFEQQVSNEEPINQNAVGETQIHASNNDSDYQLSFDESDLKKIQNTVKQEITDQEKMETITRILNLKDLNLNGED